MKAVMENDWLKWSKHVLLELERLNSVCEITQREIQSIRVDIETLKVKAGVWGLIAGAVPVLIVLLFKLI